ncbi:MAG: Crp/Fnr family transcriptional regulator [Chitinophagales bacterium]
MKNPVISCFNCEVKDCSILRNCTPEFLRYIDEKKSCMQYQANQPIVFEGEITEGVFIIYNGIVKMHVKGHRGKIFVQRLAKSGEIIGHSSDQQMKQSSSVTTVTPTTVCFIENADFLKGIENCQGVRSELLSILKSEIKYVGNRTIQLVQMNVTEKIAESLLHIAHAYGLKEGGNAKHVALSRQDIADMTGTTKEQVSKVISDLRKENVIESSGKNLSILNRTRLKEIAGVK